MPDTISVITDYPVAKDSLDYLYPLGVKWDSFRNPKFNEKLETIPGAVLDLGCAGGGFVKDCVDEGRLAVGLEGSDMNLKKRRYEWDTIPDNLFTCDVTKPFTVSVNSSMPYPFNIITAWEVLEHIKKDDLDQLFANVHQHLNATGIFIVSISNKSSLNKEGIEMHKIQENKEWWTERLFKAGFIRDSDLEGYFGDDWVRTEKRSFHFVLRKKSNRVSALDYILSRFCLDFNQRSPIEIPNVGRNTLAELFFELDYRVIVEIGVEQGLYTEVLCKANPQAKIYAIDAWTAYKGYREYVTQSKIDTFYAKAKQRTAPYNCELRKAYSMDAVKEFEDESIDAVFIDGNHQFEFVAQDIGYWARKVRKGGIISGHDYIAKKNPTATHVIQAVKAYTDSYNIKPWFLLGRQEKREGEIRDKSRTWMWVKT
jgi:2-polyprenyl-3-methyl-5-hydroxy-6-metoxy-1,4-benzoquinol methylase